MTRGQEQVLTIKRYMPTMAQVWDHFVEESRNGTFLHKRGYMDYHADRFADHSLMCYADNKLIAILPAHIAADSFCSHNGLTYGGLLLPEDTTTETTLCIFNEILKYLQTQTEASRFIYKPTPYIYHSYPCEEDLYALFRYGARLTERKVSSAIAMEKPLPISGRRKLTAAIKERLRIIEDPDFAPFWQMLNERLLERYETTAVHSIDEIEMLKSRFPDNIKLFVTTDNEENLLGGVVLFITDNVVHMQYTATTDEGRRISALDHLYDYLINERYRGMRYFDFGISVENGGHFLNNGLIAYKERLGGRAVVYDTYIIDLKEMVE